MRKFIAKRWLLLSGYGNVANKINGRNNYLIGRTWAAYFQVIITAVFHFSAAAEVAFYYNCVRRFRNHVNEYLRNSAHIEGLTQGGLNVKCDPAATDESLRLPAAIYGFTAHRRYAGAFFPVAVPGDAEPVEWTRALSIAELGAADGVLTKRILGRMRADAGLEAFEIQPHFVRRLRG